jgi:hypothetical protein
MIRSAKHALLARYFNTGQINRYDLLIGGLSPTFLFRKNAASVKSIHQSKSAGIAPGSQTNFNIPAYNGNDQVVKDIASYLSANLSEDLAGAFVHGSLATGECILYSDFDGLLILKDEVFNDPKRIAMVAEKISRSFSIMISFDPLQHHGWFIVTEKDLSCFPHIYFPLVLFENAASLLAGNSKLQITAAESDRTYFDQLKRLASSVIRKIENGNGLKNMFVLKGMLSEFMLLPSLYLEAKTGKGVLKKDSFRLAKADFTADEWLVMDEVSQIRCEWEYKPSWTIGNSPIPVTPLVKKLQASRAGGVPEHLRLKLDASFTSRMRNLAALFIAKGL